MKYRNILKSALIYAGIIVFFAILAYAYAPEVLSGKVVNQSDTSGWIGMTHEISEHNAAHPDDKTYWTNSMFGGMPTAAMYDEFEGDWTNPLYKGLMHLAARPVNFFLICLIGAFLMLLAFGVDKWIAVAGAVAVTFCSYNLQIIQVGHNTKMQAIAFAPWVIAGIVFTYKCALGGYRARRRGISAGDSEQSGGKFAEKAAGRNPSEKARPSGWKAWLPMTVLGSVLFALALSFQVKANHPQISYYLAIIVFIYALTLLIWLCAKKARRVLLGRFFIASALLVIVGGIGVATNLNKLIPTYKYSKYTMRGGSELSATTSTHNDKGLDLAYATAWSYGVEETPNLLIPNFNGGSSAGGLGTNSETYKLLQRAGQQNLGGIMKALPLYWGPQPFTAGPMYMGAITVFLFILGLCLYRGKEKWWLLVAALIGIFLAWGSHFMWFTKLWFYYAPMYSKFRTVSMALVILQLCLPVLGFVALDGILKQDYERKQVLRALYISFGVTAGFCLICILFPGIAGSFTAASDAGQADILTQALAADRRHLLVSDAWRSLVLVTLTAILLWFLFGRKTQYSHGTTTGTLALVLCLMMIFDLWGVGKRYLNKSHFVNKREFTGQFAARPVDNLIKEDPSPEYRVLDISVNTFNSSETSYHHKSIGGYSPVKLQRYQDLIDHYLTGEINSVIRAVNNSATVSEAQENLPELPVVSMLNGKYVIIGDNYAPLVNGNAFGNAWFVDDFVEAPTPDDEIDFLGSTDLKTTAIIGSDFKGCFSQFDLTRRGTANGGAIEYLQQIGSDFSPAGKAGQEAANKPGDEAGTEDYIELTKYAPNELHYYFRTEASRAVIFSEIYYPEGWKLFYRPASNSQTSSADKDTVSTSKTSSTNRSAVSDFKTSAGEIEIFRADWILRGAVLPAGQGELVMRFEPRAYKVGENLSRACSITLLLLLLLSISFCVKVGGQTNPTDISY